MLRYYDKRITEPQLIGNDQLNISSGWDAVLLRRVKMGHFGLPRLLFAPKNFS